ncbi:MAG: hypothetical protein AAF382_09090 [Pseudomonadota bacterium]
MNAFDLHNKPWRDLSARDLGHATHVPSMLNDEETRLYFWMARHLAGAEGHIVDLGSFAGGSTAYLAEGNRAGGGAAQVFAFDQFSASEKAKTRQLYAKGVDAFEGADILPLSKRLLAPWSRRIEFRKCRIENETWTDGPIALMTLDASKTSATMDQMADIFFPHLIPGVSVIIQQDELHWREPWIAVQMEKFKDCFEPLCFVPGGAMAYRCVQHLSAARVRAGQVDGMDDAAMINALSQAKTRLKRFGVAPQLSRQMEAIRRNPGRRKSWRFTNRAPLACES